MIVMPKPCPFCGNLPTIETVRRKSTRITATRVFCNYYMCGGKPDTGAIWTKESEVIRKWNERRRKPTK
jgi:hypothetical protein